jgi:hypothetical protein
VYRSLELRAPLAARPGTQSGFRDHPRIVDPEEDTDGQGFHLQEYPLDTDHWLEAYVIVTMTRFRSTPRPPQFVETEGIARDCLGSANAFFNRIGRKPDAARFECQRAAWRLRLVSNNLDKVPVAAERFVISQQNHRLHPRLCH